MTTQYINLYITEKQYNELMRSLLDIIDFPNCPPTKGEISRLKKHFNILEKAKKHNDKLREYRESLIGDF